MSNFTKYFMKQTTPKAVQGSKKLTHLIEVWQRSKKAEVVLFLVLQLMISLSPLQM